MPPNRLYPRRHERVYAVLTHLRRAIEQTIATHANAGSKGFEGFEGSGGKGRLLDYGAGDSPYRPLFVDAGFNYVAADLADNAAADIVLTDDGGVDQPDASFDWILSSQVLEHVPNVQAYLREARRLVRDEGTLVLSTHGFWQYHGHPHDYWRWTRPGLIREVQAAGWRVVEVINVLNLASAGIQLFQDVMGRRVPRLLRPVFFWICQSAIVLSEALMREPPPNDAVVFVVIARPGAIASENS